jgi:transcriptional regulator with XRE-family HTH domain
MSERDLFGPNLRRIRVQHGVTLEQIARDTKVSVDLWAGLERNDFSRWPSGIYARAYIREYATHVGVDPDTTIDDFCRWFTHGDRRAERVVRGQAAIVGHQLQWQDELAADGREDRRSGASPSAEIERPPVAFTQIGRVVAATSDLLVVLAVGAAFRGLTTVGWAASLALCAIAYHAISLVTLGCTPSVWAIETYLTHRHPITGRLPDSAPQRFPRLLRDSERV